MGDKSLSIEQRIQRFSNTNLLDNWYYPAAVNQKGKTEYSGGGYTIDRWRSDDGLLVRDGYIEFPVGTNLYQTFEPEFTKLLLGKQLTLSVLYQDGDLEWATLTAPSAFPGNDFSVVSVSTPHATFLGMMFFPNRTAQLFRISGINLRIVAAKLELGPFQTLAHKEGDKWVLNDPPPNYALELAKCQRYFIRVGNSGLSDSAQAVVAFANAANTTHAAFHLPLPVTMRSRPAIAFKNVALRTGIKDIEATPAGFSGITYNGVYTGANVESGLIQGNTYMVRCMNGGYIDLDANL